MVNAITKSGTNTYTGSVSGYFRDDNFNAKDFIADRVLPYSNQQISPRSAVRSRDRMHFFAQLRVRARAADVHVYQPLSVVQHRDLDSHATRSTRAACVDMQFNNSPRLMGALTSHRRSAHDPRSAGGANLHPSPVVPNRASDTSMSLTQDFRPRIVHELKWLVSHRFRTSEGVAVPSPRSSCAGTRWANRPLHAAPSRTPLKCASDLTLIHDGGRHELKVGGEFLQITCTPVSCRMPTA